MADITASPPAMRSPGPASSSRPFAVLAAVLLSSLLLLSCRPTNAAAAASTPHVRHKRTVSDLVEGLMNAMYFHSDPEPVQSTVIARITHLPATKIYKYVPVPTLKLSKLRARQISEPKFKIKYPKKYSIKTDDSSLTVVKNDLPWTLHPLPPPLPTSKTIKLEVDKSMPWALHPLPPPVKTKSYSEYYWPDTKARPKFVYRAKPAKPHRFGPPVHKYRVKTKHRVQKKPSTYYAPPVDYGHDEYNHVDNNNNNNHDGVNNNNNNNNKRPPVDYNEPDDHKYEDDYPHNKPDDDYSKPDGDLDKHHHEFTKHAEFGPVDFKHIDFKQVDYKHVDYKSPDYKTDFPKHGDDENDGGGDHDVVFHHPFAHDDHDSRLDDMSSSSSPPPPPPQPPSPADFVSHITIEPSIQIAAFSDTELQGDGSSRDSVSHGGGDGEPPPQQQQQQQKCQCQINGHRHRRDVTAKSAAADPDGSPVTLHAFFGPGGGGVGHATEVQIVKSHDITDQSRADVHGGRNAKRTRDMSAAAEPWRPTVPEAKNNGFRDESDKFRVDFGGGSTTGGLWDNDEPRPAAADVGRSMSAGSDADGGDQRHAREPERGKNYHVITTVTKTTNGPGDGDDDGGGGGIGYSVQTPFSVSSFSSNVRHPLLSSLRQSGYTAEPLDFEQFGFKSALIDDRPLGSGGRLRGGGPSGFADGYGSDDDDATDLSGRLTSPFSRDFGDDDDRGPLKSSRPFRHRSQSGSSLFDNRFRGASSDDSVLEFFQPVVIDFDKSLDDKSSKLFRYNNGGSDKSRYFGKSDSAGFSKFKRNQNSDPLRLPGGLHESNENLSRKMIFHPSTFDID